MTDSPVSADKTSKILKVILPLLVIGETLDQGAALLQIDPRDYRVAMDEQRAALAKAEFDLKMELGNQAVAKREWSLLNPSAGEVNTLSRQLALRRPHLKEKRMALAAAKSRHHPPFSCFVHTEACLAHLYPCFPLPSPNHSRLSPSFHKSASVHRFSSAQKPPISPL